MSLLKENDRALADFDMAIRLEPKHPLAYVNRGATLNDRGERAAAIASINKALQLSPGFPPALEALKKIGAANGKAQKPLRTLSPEVGRRNFRECALPVSGIDLERKDINRIIPACTVLIEAQGGSDDDRSIVHQQRGSMYRRLGKYELALADFSQSIRYDPKSADAYTGRGNAYRGLHQLDQALADHSEAIRLEPNNASPYNNRGNTWRDKKDYDKAIADYDAAIKLSPNYAGAFYNRGNARLEAGDKNGSLADYREALKLNPNLQPAADMLKELGVNP